MQYDFSLKTGMSNQTCPTKINMSDSAQTRRSFIKGSLSKTLLAANVAAVSGLINAPGNANAGPGGPTTQPYNGGAFTVNAAGGQLANGGPGFNYTLYWWNGSGTAYMSVTYFLSNNPTAPQTYTWQESCPAGSSSELRSATISKPGGFPSGVTVSSINTPVASTTPP